MSGRRSEVHVVIPGASMPTRMRRLAGAWSVAAVCLATMAVRPVLAGQPPAPRDHHLPAAAGAHLVPGHQVAPGRAPARPQTAPVEPAPVWPAAGVVDVDLPAPAAGRTAAAPDLAWAAGMPVQVGSAAVSKVHVQVLDHAAARRAGVSGFLFQLARSDGGAQPAPVTARIDYSGFAHAYGGGFASRLTVVALPACALTTPQLPACQLATPLPTVNDTAAGTLTVQADAQPAPGTVRTMGSTSTVLAATTSTSGGTGDFKATTLPPSATWGVGLQTGDFTWSYPLPGPPAIAGAAPSMALAYDSGSTDGETAQANTQTSQVGEGFDLAGGGFIERRYKACADEITTASSKTGDLCWGGDNGYLSLDGRATELVKDDSSGVWHPKDDDGSRVELLTGAANGANNGEYWKITANDGTQYFFGKNQLPGYTTGDFATFSTWTVPVVGLNSGEPCHGANYASSMCYQAWRWNLDLVVDPNGNAREYFYSPEYNDYLFDSTGATPGTAKVYTRGGSLNQVGCSSQSSNVYAHIPMRLMLSSGDRCLSGTSCSTHTGQFWPDTPWDLSCSGSGCGATGHEAPSFWTQTMLTGVSAEVYEGSAGYVTMDSWSLGHVFLSADTDDLWLSSISHKGEDGGSASLPSVSIMNDTGNPNRVSGDGYPSMVKYRVANITSEAGGQVAVTYDAANCGSSLPAPSNDTLPCFQQWWTPGDPQVNEAPVSSFFYKYPVATVAVHDDTGASTDDETTSYTYLDGTAWHFDNDDGLVSNKYKSYSQWRGYEHVHVVTGSSNETRGETDYTFMRGMDGDQMPGGATASFSIGDSTGTRIADSERLNGFTREEITYNGPGGAEVSGTIDDPWQSADTADSIKSWGTLTAKQTDIAAMHQRVDLASGGVRQTEVDNTFNSQGLLTQSSDLGDITTTDRLCTVNTYVQNSSAHMLDYIDERTVTAAACGTSGALVSDTHHLYDGGAFGAAPTHGNVTETDRWSAGDPGVPDHWVAASRETYDGFGRVTSSKDAAGNTTSTTYSSAYGSGNATTQTVATDPLGFTSAVDLDAGRGLPLDTIDPNGERTDMTYDPLGRLTAVWKPGQSKASGAKANFTFAYQVTNKPPSSTGVITTTAVTTNRLINPSSGLYVTSVASYDGLLRPRQTQQVAEAVDGAMLVTDTLYDSLRHAVPGQPVTGALLHGQHLRRGGPQDRGRPLLGRHVPVADHLRLRRRPQHGDAAPGRHGHDRRERRPRPRH